MTTLRRAAWRLLGLDSLPVWMLAALLVAATSPAWASHGGGGHGGDGGGGGHAGGAGGGGHASGGGGHASGGGGGGHASGGGGGGHASGGGGHASGGGSHAGGGGGGHASGGSGHSSGGGAHFGGGPFGGGGGAPAGRFGTPRGGGYNPGFSSRGAGPSGPGSSGGRTAIPGRPGGSFRQPGSFRDGHDRGDHGERGDHGGFHGRDHEGFEHDRFFFGGGIGLGFGYDPFLWGWFPYAPYWGPSYWQSLYYPYYPSYGWDYGYYPPYHSYPPEAYGAPPSGNYSGDGDYSGGGGDYGPPPSGDSRGGPRKHSSRDRMGAVEIGVSPADTQVYLNGQYIGVAEDFDGWPQYLWLEPGTYDIVFYHDGFKTLARQVTVYAGQRVTYDDKLERGQAIRPEDLPSKSHERRDERMRFEGERNRRLSSHAAHGAHASEAAEAPGASAAGEGSDWQDRVRNSGAKAPAGSLPSAPPSTSGAPPMSDAAADRGDYAGRADHAGSNGEARLHLSIEPEDASVYLDGRFVGTAAEINERGAGLVVGAGRHRLAVVRPGRKAEERELDITAGNDLDVDVKLERLQR